MNITVEVIQYCGEVFWRGSFIPEKKETTQSSNQRDVSNDEKEYLLHTQSNILEWGGEWANKVLIQKQIDLLWFKAGQEVWGMSFAFCSNSHPQPGWKNDNKFAVSHPLFQPVLDKICKSCTENEWFQANFIWFMRQYIILSLLPNCCPYNTWWHEKNLSICFSKKTASIHNIC